MTNFTNNTNEGRVQKIVDLVDLLIKSSTSNNAERDEIWQLMEPSLERISVLLESEPPKAPEASPEQAQSAPTPSQENARWFDVLQMAKECPVNELFPAMNVFLHRLEEELDLQDKAA